MVPIRDAVNSRKAWSHIFFANFPIGFRFPVVHLDYLDRVLANAIDPFPAQILFPCTVWSGEFQDIVFPGAWVCVYSASLGEYHRLRWSYVGEINNCFES